MLILDGTGLDARDGKGPKMFHEDWSRGLHYLTKGHQSGNDGDRKGATGPIAEFVEHLEGGTFAREVDEYREKCKDRGFSDDILQQQAGGASGGPGQRRAMELWDHDAGGIRLIRGDLISRATRAAEEWRRDHPATFRYFCKTWSIDPGTLSVLPSGDAAKSAKSSPR